ncbi:hypothetical protein [Arthrobacter sp. ISL-28]|uniref:hypothetical protein n=1 Tax=Arthrobacter sp. ISL-28 TaxID=2819108 RepID=UPI001BE60AE2|nr:hypothetical protein [Arthrobacter sp. ISL-28]MBT2522547.1 hypothetical protein [Arthrobacter sp. ISL-28]
MEETIVDVLESVSKGMRVVDVSGKDIGTVEQIVPPNEKAEVFEEAVAASQQDLITLGLNSLFGREPKVPELMARRLFHAGYIKIDARGFWASDSYAAADAITRVEEGNVYLNLTRHELAAQV